jgi:TolB-like protein
MKTLITRLLVLFLVSILLWSCSGAGRFAAKGNKAQKSGRVGEASYFYIQALRRNSNHIKSLLGLQTAGQEHLNRLLDKYFQFHNDQKLKDAVYAYKDANEFHKEVNRVKVDLRFPEYYREYYQEDYEAFLNQTYAQGQEAFRKQQFKEAEQLFSEIKKWDANYKDVSKMRAKAELIPLYEEALRDYDNAFYKTAHRKFVRVTELDPAYEQAALYVAESLKRGLFTVAYTPFTDQSGNTAFTSVVGAKVLAELSKVQNPFFQVVDRSNMDKVLAEQRLALTTASDYVKVGELLGAKAILSAKVIEYQFQGGRIHQEKKPGYEAFTDSVLNTALGRKEAVTKYRKVYYQEFSGQSQLRCKIQYQLVSTENGRTLVADLIDEQLSDQVNYITYNGNIRSLVPGNWSQLNVNQQSDKVFDTPSQRNELRRKADARKSLKPEAELRNDAVQKSANKLVNSILAYEAQIQ